ncbi:unnamed protein product [Calypogeia fissa]
MTLPEDLVERILAMLPFPVVFKARVLSKSWLAKLSPISALGREEEKKQSAISFQKQIVCVNEGFLQIEGALLLVTAFERSRDIGSNALKLYVGNILTRNWKQLPPHPRSERWLTSNCKLVCHTRESYKVVIVSGDGHRPHLVHIYNSEKDAWNKLDLSDRFFPKWGPSAYLDGVLYMVGLSSFKRDTSTQLQILAVKEEALEDATIRLEEPYVRGRDGHGEYPIISNGNLLMVMPRGPPISTATDILRVMKVDLQSRRLLEVSLALLGDHKAGRMRPKPVSDGHYIFLGVGMDGRLMLAYNVHDDEWTCFPFLANDDGHGRFGMDCYQIDSPFRPGLNPFAAV